MRGHTANFNIGDTPSSIGDAMLMTAKRAILGAIRSAGYGIANRGTSVPATVRLTVSAPFGTAAEATPPPAFETDAALAGANF